MSRPSLHSALLAAVIAVYPIIAGLGIQFVDGGAIFWVLVVLLAARLLLPKARKVPTPVTMALVCVIAAGIGVSLEDPSLATRLYPVFMNAALAGAFVYSLVMPPSIIESLARIVEPTLPEEGIRYTRNVTAIWMGFFLLNGAIALWTALASTWTVWSIYNGFISYLLAGLLMCGEMLVRRHVRTKRASA
ncbi:hypothetical protein [Emcibacter sp. SYSU 3D8]|uniref:COG4648 family protein n=1 Tax=Emcibacter sp. SYSU 3D8 TaxID=3133969 RepID=UPI0031FE491C